MSSSDRKTFHPPGHFAMKYQLTEQTLGRGNFGTVYLGRVKSTLEQVAVKSIRTEGLSKRERAKVKSEVDILINMNHPNIVRFYGAYEESDAVLIVMEYIRGGDLFGKLLELHEKKFTEDQARKIIRSLAVGLQYCNSKGIVHRDVKPENILLTGTGDDVELKIVDFNLSKKIDQDQITHHVLETICGTWEYTAPEVLLEKSYNFKCDVWSVGVITFIILSGGFLPFFEGERQNRRDLIEKVKKADWEFEPAEAWDGVSSQGKDLVSKLIMKDPDTRLDFAQLLAHPWFKVDSKNMNKQIDTSALSTLNMNREAMASEKKLRSAMYVKMSAMALGDLMDTDSDLDAVVGKLPPPGDEFFE